jgi:O-antigen ligase
MARTGKLSNLLRFDLLASILLLASFFFIAPRRYDGDQIFSLVACMVLVALSAFYPAKRQVDLRLPAAFFIFACAVGLWQFAWFKVYALVILFIGFAALKVFAERTDLNLKRFGWMMFGVCVLMILHVQIQKAGLDGFYVTVFVESAGVFIKPWALGCFAALCVPFLFAVHPALPAVAFPLLYWSHSTLCVAAGLAGWAYLAAPKFRWILFALLPVAVGAYIFKEGHVDNHRLEIWKNTWKYVQEAPWLGHGWGGWRHAGFVRQINDVWVGQPWAHNEFYQTLFDLGRVGLAMLLAWVAMLWLGVRKELRAAILILCLLAFFHPLMRWGRLVLFPMMILGFSVADATRRGPRLVDPQAPKPIVL